MAQLEKLVHTPTDGRENRRQEYVGLTRAAFDVCGFSSRSQTLRRRSANLPVPKSSATRTCKLSASLRISSNTFSLR